MKKKSGIILLCVIVLTGVLFLFKDNILHYYFSKIKADSMIEFGYKNIQWKDGAINLKDIQITLFNKKNIIRIRYISFKPDIYYFIFGKIVPEKISVTGVDADIDLSDDIDKVYKIRDLLLRKISPLIISKNNISENKNHRSGVEFKDVNINILFPGNFKLHTDKPQKFILEPQLKKKTLYVIADEFSLNLNGIKMNLFPDKSGKVFEVNIKKRFSIWINNRILISKKNDPVFNIKPFNIDISGEMTLEDEELYFKCKADIDNLSISNKLISISRNMIEQIRMNGDIRYFFKTGDFYFVNGELKLHKLPLNITSFCMNFKKDNIFNLNADFSWAVCEDIMSSLPVSFKSKLTGYDFDGRIKADIDININMDDIDNSHINVRIDDECNCNNKDMRFDISKFRNKFVHRIIDKEEIRIVKGPGDNDWVDINHISVYVVNAVVTLEDESFPEHKGYSIKAIESAVKNNLRKKKIVSGGSTITMQVVRNLFSFNEKTLARKFQEAVLAWQMEKELDKDKIMELYLNIAEFGPDIYGIRSASSHYFKKRPDKLSILESIFIIKMLPGPKNRYTYFIQGKKDGKLDKKWKRVLNKTAKRMYQLRYITKDEMEYVYNTDLVFPWEDL